MPAPVIALIPAIKDFYPLADMARQYIPEMKKHGRGFLSLCPFHSEKTPSLVIHAAGSRAGKWNCFGCGAHGDVIDFFARIEGISKGRAIHQLAEEAGLQSGTKPLTRDQRKYMADLRLQSEYWWRKRHTEAAGALASAMESWQTEGDDSAAAFCGARLRYIEGLNAAARWQIFNALRTGTDLTQWKRSLAEEAELAAAWMQIATSQTYDTHDQARPYRP